MIRVFGTCQVWVPEYRYPRYVPVPGRYQSKFSLKAGILETEKGIVVYSFLWPCTKYVVSLKSFFFSGKFSVCRICCTKHVVSLKVRGQKIAGRKSTENQFKRALLLKQVL